MEAQNFLTQWIKYMLIVVPLGAGSMVTYQALRKSLSTNTNEIEDHNKKIKRTIQGAILIETLGGLVEIVKSFFI